MTDTNPPVPPACQLNQWENEGGHLAEETPSLPEGIVAIPQMQYAVGPYRYSKLSDALAENQRQFSKRNP